MIELVITTTRKRAGRHQERYRCGTETSVFKDLSDAKAWLTQRYAGNKRSPMYIDTAQGPQQIGFVYHYRQREYACGTRKTFYAEDWVEILYVYRDHLNLIRRKDTHGEEHHHPATRSPRRRE